MAKKESDLPRTTPAAPRKSSPPREDVAPPKRPASSSRKKSEPTPKSAEKPRRKRNYRLRALVAIVVFALVVLVVLEPSVLGALLPFGQPAQQVITDPNAPLASFYAPAVRHWAPQIEEWAKAYELNPNVIAIVMQIESCGDPEAISFAGALGLMQVMPLHFDDGENMLNPDTNVRRGMNFFNQCLREFADWDIGLALACYNGGPGVVYRDMSTWPAETQRYYRWATGLWEDAVRGDGESDTLEDWLSSGGQSLCTRAANRVSADTSG